MIRRYVEADIPRAAECDLRRRGLDSALRRAPRLFGELGINAPANWYGNYPWTNDVAVTNAWISDPKYLVSGTGIATWHPSKGAIDAVQATGSKQPTLGTIGNGKRGALLFDGTQQWMSADGLASLVSGSDIAFSYTAALSLPTVPGTAKNLFGFGASGNSATWHVFQLTISSGTKFSSQRHDDSTGNVGGVVTSTTPVANTLYVITEIFTGTTTTIRINKTTSNINAAIFNVGTVTPTAFTLGGWRSTTTPVFGNVAIRAFVFGTGVWGSSTYLPIEEFLMADAA